MRSLGLVLALLANLIGGLTYPGQKVAMEGLPPATVACGRNVVALVVMAAWLLWKGRLTARFRAGDWARLVVLGVLAYGAPLLLGILGTAASTAGNASILILLEPGSILVFSWLLLRERVGATQVLGVLLGLGGGLVLVLEPGSLGGLARSEHLAGNLMLAVQAVLWGLYSPVMKPLVARHHPFEITFWAMAMAQLVLTPAALLDVPRWEAGPELGPALGWVLALGVVGSLLGTLFWTWALKWIRASTMAPFLFVQPLAGAGAGVLLLGETLSPGALWGGALIACGVVCVLRPPRTALPAGEPA